MKHADQIGDLQVADLTTSTFESVPIRFPTAPVAAQLREKAFREKCRTNHRVRHIGRRKTLVSEP
eukprot:2971584-Rhodomonas_salina.1